MKIKLSFTISPFSYSAPIIVQNHSLIKNEVLTVSIFQNETLVNQIDLCSLAHFQLPKREHFQ